jgi:hypothetical protein
MNYQHWLLWFRDTMDTEKKWADHPSVTKQWLENARAPNYSEYMNLITKQDSLELTQNAA